VGVFTIVLWVTVRQQPTFSDEVSDKTIACGTVAILLEGQVEPTVYTAVCITVREGIENYRNQRYAAIAIVRD
jgi:hypothetical protein